MTKYIELLDRVERDSYFEINYNLTIDIPAPMQPFFGGALTVSKSGILSCNNEETIPGLKAKLLALWNDYNTEVTTSHKWKYYGSYFDGTTWVLGGTN